MNTPIACPARPSVPSLIGSSPKANAIGAPTGAAARSTGRTHSPQAVHASRKTTPYAVVDAENSSASRQPKPSMTTVASSPAPKPVRRGAG
ncbi:hypothetical protein SPAR_08526 [Streptomyces sparsogenes DSM 40356]|uniref:Uncharacterized protein n=1 Tax=Streptomyces sparsogenes DSM 40356 TaxID=1331668 RepID=A0A1R1SPJ2_9ACTN|nr:hypothetical protein SPAR_08526 [Streptomyces sparsogenes DSM 40356]